MNSRFQPDGESNESSRFIDRSRFGGAESLDAREQHFATTSSASDSGADQCFVIETNQIEENRPVQSEPDSISSSKLLNDQSQVNLSDSAETVGTVPPELLLEQNTDSWRREVAAKVNRYKARKPRPPRYPSLQLKFEPRESLWKDSGRDEHSHLSDSLDYSAHNRQAVAVQQSSVIPQTIQHEQQFLAHESLQTIPETTARILEFPRSLVLPGILDELAEPVSDKPRILDVPDHTPLAPALGGISIEAIEKIAEEKRPGIDIPLQSAATSRRLCAALTDAFLVVLASMLFGYIFFCITNAIPPAREAVATALIFTGLLWALYQYLLLVHTGTTPGLKLAKLHLHNFDGTLVPLKMRRWRVLASFLSGVSLGIG